ncbi:MAG: hypothetical protein GY788_28950 [bacterium]|nr:hypothetical protein [bacterium]
MHQHDRVDDLDLPHHQPQRETLARRRDMRRRWCAAGMLETERKFRRIRGHRQMPHLVTALARHTSTVTPPCDTEHNELAA